MKPIKVLIPVISVFLMNCNFDTNQKPNYDAIAYNQLKKAEEYFELGQYDSSLLLLKIKDYANASNEYADQAWSLRIKIRNKKEELGLSLIDQENNQQENIRTFSNAEVAKYTVSSLMGTDPKIIKVAKESNFYKVWYNRADDGKYFDYKIRIDGNNVVWGAYDGRWRTTKWDEKISYREENNKLIIIQRFEDGSSSKNEFSK